MKEDYMSSSTERIIHIGFAIIVQITGHSGKNQFISFPINTKKIISGVAVSMEVFEWAWMKVFLTSVCQRYSHLD